MSVNSSMCLSCHLHPAQNQNFLYRCLTDTLCVQIRELFFNFSALKLFLYTTQIHTAESFRNYYIQEWKKIFLFFYRTKRFIATSPTVQNELPECSTLTNSRIFNTYFNIILPSITSSQNRAISFTLFYQWSLHVSNTFQILRLQKGLK